MVARYSRASPATAWGGASLRAARNIPRSSVSRSTVVSGCMSPGAPWHISALSAGPSAAHTRCTLDFEQPTRRAVSVTPSLGNISTIVLRSESVSFLTLPTRAPSLRCMLGNLRHGEKKRRNAPGRAFPCGEGGMPQVTSSCWSCIPRPRNADRTYRPSPRLRRRCQRRALSACCRAARCISCARARRCPYLSASRRATRGRSRPPRSSSGFPRAASSRWAGRICGTACPAP